MQAALLKGTLLAVIIVAILNHKLWRDSKSRMSFDRLLGIANIYVGFHALFVFLIEYFFLKNPLYDRLVPFALMYGPFLYFAFFIILNGHISKIRVLLHATPFLFFCSVYCVLLIQGMPGDLVFLYGRCLGLSAVLSFSCYIICAMVYNSRPIAEQQLRKNKLVVIIAIVLLLFATMVMLAGIFSSGAVDNFKTSSVMYRLLMYGCMVCCVLVINRFFHLLSGNSEESESILSVEVNIDQVLYEGKYEKSALAEAQLDVYLVKLEMLMDTQQFYLHQDLSLFKLAKLIHIPKHHITQVLNIKLKMNFYEYVNGLRVEHACLLLAGNSTDTLENIAEQSGFNSKVSFNRHFKALKGLTPSEYRVKCF